MDNITGNQMQIQKKINVFVRLVTLALLEEIIMDIVGNFALEKSNNRQPLRTNCCSVRGATRCM